MLKEISDFFTELTGGEKPVSQCAEGDYRVAAAALLVHVATVDHGLTEQGRTTLHDLLKQRFALDDAATGELIDAAVAADRDAIDLYHFTSLINRTLDDDARRRLIEMMWEMALSDGRVSEFEDNILWRVADLINVSQRERIEIRRRVADAQKQA